MTVIYSEPMKQPTDIVIRYTNGSAFSKWHILHNGVLQDAAATPERALEAAARYIISKMNEDEDSGEMRIRWVDVPAGFTPPDASSLMPIIEDESEPVQ
jgi:hypothetical protein